MQGHDTRVLTTCNAREFQLRSPNFFLGFRGGGLLSKQSHLYQRLEYRKKKSSDFLVHCQRSAGVYFHVKMTSRHLPFQHKQYFSSILQRRGGELSSLSWPMFIDISYNLDKNITSCNCHFTVCGVCSLQIASFISYSTAVLKYFIGCKVLWDSSKYEKCCLNGDLISDVKHQVPLNIKVAQLLREPWYCTIVVVCNCAEYLKLVAPFLHSVSPPDNIHG